jgi:hypothetical protein
VLLLNGCLLLLFISLSSQSGNFWIRPRINKSVMVGAEVIACRKVQKEIVEWVRTGGKTNPAEQSPS